MRSGTLSRTRIFRADPDLDAAVAASAARRGMKVSAFLRETLRNVVMQQPASDHSLSRAGACR